MTDVIDITVPVSGALPIWPGSPGFSLRKHMDLNAGDAANASLIRTDLHVGTHVDAPSHFIAEGGDLESVGLDPFIGQAEVIEVFNAREIGASSFNAACIDESTTRLLVKTQREPDWFLKPFDPNFAAVSESGAEWLVERELKLVGIDYLSIQRFEDGPETHQVLLGAGICILEGLDLSSVGPGIYDLCCLPTRLLDAEAAPARAILRRSD